MNSPINDKPNIRPKIKLTGPHAMLSGVLVAAVVMIVADSLRKEKKSVDEDHLRGLARSHVEPQIESLDTQVAEQTIDAPVSVGKKRKIIERTIAWLLGSRGGEKKK